ncbi:MAG: metal-dependent hydrolase [Candidatus Nanoarchaeia archaeon]|nr:metal-dependent hydrolase [Candidatus Nanoarchaeia archaeon]
MFRTHFALGLFVGLFSLSFINEIFTGPRWLFVVIVAIASSFPDIDHPKSKISKLFFPFSWMISWVVSHRGIFHSIFPVIGLYLIFDYFGFGFIGLALAIGYFSHLLGDMFTKSGIDFLYPISRFKISGPITTGGILESVLFVLLVLLDVVLVVKHNFINISWII